jgi:hypothetical protein
MTVHCKLHIEIAPNLLIDEVDNNSDGTLKKSVLQAFSTPEPSSAARQ